MKNQIESIIRNAILKSAPTIDEVALREVVEDAGVGVVAAINKERINDRIQQILKKYRTPDGIDQDELDELNSYGMNVRGFKTNPDGEIVEMKSNPRLSPIVIYGEPLRPTAQTPVTPTFGDITPPTQASK